jgi:hypothetical protein
LAALLLLLLLASCLPSAGPALPERQHRQQRLVRASFADTWRAVRAAVGDRRLRVTEEDESVGVLRADLRRRRRSNQEEIEQDLLRVAEVEDAKRRGLQVVSEYVTDYTIEVAHVDDEETRLEVSTRITAVDRSEAILVGPGFVQVIPRNFDVPSKGVLERELVRGIGDHLFISEEMLYYLGMLGRD